MGAEDKAVGDDMAAVVVDSDARDMGVEDAAMEVAGVCGPGWKGCMIDLRPSNSCPTSHSVARELSTTNLDTSIFSC